MFRSFSVFYLHTTLEILYPLFIDHFNISVQMIMISVYRFNSLHDLILILIKQSWISLIIFFPLIIRALIYVEFTSFLRPELNQSEAHSSKSDYISHMQYHLVLRQIFDNHPARVVDARTENRFLSSWFEIGWMSHIVPLIMITDVEQSLTGILLYLRLQNHRRLNKC